MTLKKTCILAAAGLLLFYGFLAVWPVEGATVTREWVAKLSTVPEKITAQSVFGHSLGTETALTPALSVTYSTTIENTELNYVIWRVWWFDSTQAPATFYQSDCRARVTAGDSAQFHYLGGYTGVTVDSAIIEWFYGSTSGTPVHADTGTSVDSLWSQPYLNDTLPITVVSSAKFGTQWNSALVEFCAATTSLSDTVYDSTSTDTLFVVVADSGAGLNAVQLYFVDTSASPDSLIPRVKFAVRTAAGATVLKEIYASLSGTKTAMLDDGSYEIRASAPNYYFDSYDLTVSGDDDSVQIAGYGSFLTNHAYIYGNAGTSNRFGLVTVVMPKNLNNACDSIVAPRRHWQFEIASDGTWGGYVPYSSCFADEQYTVTVGLGPDSRSTSVTVPDSASYKIFWQ